MEVADTINYRVHHVHNQSGTGLILASQTLKDYTQDVYA